MNSKKLMLLLMIAALILPIFPVMAIQEQDPNQGDDVYFYDDFFTGYTPGQTTFNSGLSFAGVSGTQKVERSVLEDQSGVLAMTDNRSGVEFYKDLGIIPNKPKLVMQVRVKPLVNYAGAHFSTGANATAAFAVHRVAGANGFKKEVGGPVLQSFAMPTVYSIWYTVTIVYDNETDSRDIYIDDGTTVNKYANQTGATYATTGKFVMGFKTLFDYDNADFPGTMNVDFIKVSKYYDELGFKIVNSNSTELNQLEVQFDFPVSPATVTPSQFYMDEALITSVTPDAHIPNRFRLTLNQNLDPETEYFLYANGVKDISGRESYQENAFTTRDKQYKAENLRLVQGGTDLETLTAGDCKVKIDIHNEMDSEEHPVLAAISYDPTGAMTTLAMEKLTVLPNQTNILDMDFTVDNTVLDNNNLSLVLLKSEECFTQASPLVKYTLEGKTMEDYTPQQKAYTLVPDSTAQADFDTQIASIIVDSKDVEKRSISALVLKPKKTIEDIDLADPLASLVYLGVAQESFSFGLKEGEGYFPTLIQIDGSEERFLNGFYYYTPKYREEALGNINLANTPDKMAQALLDYEIACDLDLSAYHTMNAGGKQAAHNALLAEKALLIGEEYESLPQFKEKLALSVVLGNLATGTSISETLNNNRAILALDDGALELFNETLSTRAKTYLQEQWKVTPPKTQKVFSEAFVSSVIFVGIYQGENYKQTRSILNKTADIIGIDLSEYNSLKNQEYVDRKLTGKLFSDYPALRVAFRAALAEAKEEERNPEPTKVNPNRGGGGGSITTTLPEETPTPTPSKEPNFSDLAKSHWAWSSVASLYEKGVINGKTPSQFAPEDAVTRAEFAKLATLTLSLTGNGTLPFIDVSPSDWFYNYVALAYQNGMISGTTPQAFSPNQQITRQMAAAILYKGAKAKGISLTVKNTAFVDMSLVAEYATDAVGYLSGAGVISGFSDQRFGPEELLTRAEAAQLIYNLLKLI